MRIYHANKSEDLSEEYPECPEYPVYWERKQKIIEDDVTDHKPHTFKRTIPTGN